MAAVVECLFSLSVHVAILAVIIGSFSCFVRDQTVVAAGRTFSRFPPAREWGQGRHFQGYSHIWHEVISTFHMREFNEHKIYCHLPCLGIQEIRDKFRVIPFRKPVRKAIFHIKVCKINKLNMKNKRILIDLMARWWKKPMWAYIWHCWPHHSDGNMEILLEMFTCM